jgi:hypothetical protein
MQLGECANFLHPFIWSHAMDSLKEQQVCIKFWTFLFRVITGDDSWIYGYDRHKAPILPMEKSILTKTEKR